MKQFGPGHPLVFNHIPKSAGTSVSNALEQVLQPTLKVYCVDHSLLGGYDNFEDLTPQTRSTFISGPDDLPPDATFVTGHVSPGTTRARYPDGSHITMFRSPELRVISQWIHSRSLSDFDLRHYGGRRPTAMARAFTVGRRPLVEYLDHDMIAPNVDNTMTRFLAYPNDLLKPTEFIDERHDDEILGAALERLGTFDHVGLVEDPDSLAKLGRWLECEVPDTRLNERSSVKRFDLEAELRPAAREALAHRTRLDRQLWSQVARQALPDADPDAVLAAAWDKSISRYEEAMRNPGDRRPIRRTVEVVYGLAGRLRSPAGGRK